MSKLFGTDGIRGKAGEFPLDNETVRIIGSSIAKHISKEGNSSLRIIVGRDTRWSGPEIEKALFEGATSAGAECESAGVITTPGVAYLTVHQEFDLGIVISASHNPCDDNGLKVFLPSGKKLSREVEELIEKDVAEAVRSESKISAVISSEPRAFHDSYLEHFHQDFGDLDLSGKTIVADCAHGAASALAPKLLESFGANVIAINSSPDGRNINRNCGSLHLEGLQECVLRESADLGVGFDGDADRSLFVDENGNIIDGDATLWIMAIHLSARNRLAEETVVATVMSNIGLERALKQRGITLMRTSVGDKHVLEALVKGGFSIGGEQSGHIIFPKRSFVGDGMQTALFLLQAMQDSDSTISKLTDGFVQYPQILVNTHVGEKIPFEKVPRIVEAKKEVESILGDDGRLLLRYSGTENLARVMIEGEDQGQIEDLANGLASLISESLK